MKVKVINSLDILNTNAIDANGSTRVLTVVGQAGAKFSLTIKDGSERNILEDYLDNITIPKSGSYKITQKFPAYESNDFSRIDNTEVYEIKVLPGAFTKLNEHMVSSYEIKQYPDPTVTLTSTSSHTIAGSNATLKGKAMRLAETIPNNFKTSSSSLATKRFGEITYDITVTPSSGLLYVSRAPNLSKDLKKSTDIKRKIGLKKGKEKEIILSLSPDDVDQFSTPVKEGMLYNGSYTRTKLFVENLSDNNELGFSNKIRLTDTDNLAIGMAITGDNINGYISIVSIESDTDITISLKQKLTRSDQLTFTKTFAGTVDRIIDAGRIITDSEEPISNNSIISLSDDRTSIHGMIRATGSGTGTITLSSTYQVRMFGKEDVTFTQSTDNFITATPNAYTQYITTTKNTPVTIDVLLHDKDSNKSNKTPINEAQDDPSHGVLNEELWATGVGTCIYRPHTGYTGTDKFYFYTADNSAPSTLSERTPIYVTIT